MVVVRTRSERRCNVATGRGSGRQPVPGVPWIPGLVPGVPEEEGSARRRAEGKVQVVEYLSFLEYRQCSGSRIVSWTLPAAFSLSGIEWRQRQPAAMHSVGQGVSVSNATASSVALVCAIQNDMAWWASPFRDCSAWLPCQPGSNLYPEATRTFWAPIGQESGFISECRHLWVQFRANPTSLT